MSDLKRRFLLKSLTSLPIIGGAVWLQHILLRYFKPTMVGGLKGMVAGPDQAGSADQVVAELSELTQPWDVKDFIYVRSSVEYSSRKYQGAKIPGFVLRLPDEFADPKDPKSKFVVVQRICPHLGCTFSYVPSPTELAGQFNFKPPAPEHPYFACPCHLSVYDPTRKQDSGTGTLLPGKVVSGPAPRPPRSMTFDIKDGKIVITGTEAGGVG